MQSCLQQGQKDRDRKNINKNNNKPHKGSASLGDEKYNAAIQCLERAVQDGVH